MAAAPLPAGGHQGPAAPQQQVPQAVQGFPNNRVKVMGVVRYSSGLPSPATLAADIETARVEAGYAVMLHLYMHGHNVADLDIDTEIRPIDMSLRCSPNRWPLSVRRIYNDVTGFNFFVFREESGFIKLSAWPAFILGTVPHRIRAHPQVFRGDIIAITPVAGAAIVLTAQLFLERAMRRLAIYQHQMQALNNFLALIGQAMLGGGAALDAIMQAVEDLEGDDDSDDEVE